MIEPDRHEDLGAAIRAVAGTVQAPTDLRERIAAEHEHRRRRRPRRARGARLALAGALAAVLAIVLVLGGGGGPSVQEVAQAALQAPTAPAPPRAGDNPRFIDAEIGGIRFPDWEEKWGWRAVGARTDSVGGREALTVVYRKGQRGVHYTVVDGDALPLPSDGEVRSVDIKGTPGVLFADGDAEVLAWHRQGRTCLLASDTLSGEQLTRLAHW
jgi:hypothetical protein